MSYEDGWRCVRKLRAWRFWRTLNKANTTYFHENILGRLRTAIWGSEQFRRVRNFYRFYNRKNLLINFRVAKNLHTWFKSSFQYQESTYRSQEITLDMQHLYRKPIDRAVTVKKLSCQIFTNYALNLVPCSHENHVKPGKENIMFYQDCANFAGARSP